MKAREFQALARLDLGTRALRAGRPGLRPWPMWTLALLLATLAGCSALSLAYMNAPTLAMLRIDAALDLPELQQEQLADAATAVHAWHRRQPRRELAAMLREARRRLAGPIDQADGEWILTAAQEHVRQVGERLAIEFGDRMTRFSPGELARISRRLDERRREFADEIGAGEPVLEREHRIERIEEAIDDWLGSVSPRQRALVLASPAVTGFDAGLWLDERARRERRLLDALAAADGGASLTLWFNDWRQGRPIDAAARMDAQRAEAIAMWVAVLNAADAGQREHLLDRLSDWIAVFDDE
ncbi:MAG: hypothetical protein KDG52_04580 [Rhodocyclaceae bacterium]|nr:hypothetical protein [Rhodocyclaceae bacterium]